MGSHYQTCHVLRLPNYWTSHVLRLPHVNVVVPLFFAFDRLVESVQCTGPFMCYDYQIRSSTVFCIPYRLVRAMDWTFRGLGLSNVNVVVLVPLRF